MCLPNMLKALEFIPSTEEKIKRQQEKKRKEVEKRKNGKGGSSSAQEAQARQGRKAFWIRLSQTARRAYKTRE